MKFLSLFLLLLCPICFFPQENPKISTIQFVEILNDNREEALYYYQNNWKQLREKALLKGHIAGYHFMETEKSEEAPYDFILMTIYSNEKKFANREVAFQKLISERGDLKLLNDKKPLEFRKSVMVNERVVHLE